MNAAHTRPTDLPMMKVTREVTVGQIVALILAGAGHAAFMYYTVQRQGELIQSLSQSVEKLTLASQAKDKLDNDQSWEIILMKQRLTVIEQKQVQLEVRETREVRK